MGSLKSLNNKIGERLVIIEEVLGIKPGKMADIGGCSRATYYRYRKSESEPTISFLNNILKKETGINAKWLLTGRGSVLNTNGNSNSDCPRELQEKQNEFVPLPLYSMETENGGEGKLNIGQWNDSPHTLPLSKMFVEEVINLNAEQLFVLSVKCNSMSPEITSGSLVLVDRAKTDITVDGIFVVQFDEIIRLKLVQRLPENRVRLTTLNKKFDPIEITLDQHEHFKVLGRVVWVGTPY